MSGTEQAADPTERHAAHYLALAERIWRTELFTARREAALSRLEREDGHLRTALANLIARGDAERAERMVRALRDYWWARSRLAETWEWIGKLLALPELPASSATHAAALDDAGALAFAVGDHATARGYFEQGLAIRRKTGTKTEIASSLHHLASVLRWGQGDTEMARLLYEEALEHAREAGSRVMMAAALMPLGCLALDRGDLATAHSLLAEGMALFAEARLTMGFPLALEEFGALAASRSQLHRALVLFGAGARQHEHLGTIQLPHIKAWVERYTALARQGLSGEASAAAWAQGQAMALEQALAYARSEQTTERNEA